MITLALDASTYVGTVAVFDDTRLIAERSATMRGREAERLMPAVSEALRDAVLTRADIARVVCGAGPGSFTSLRIAASIAKGVAAGRAVPLYEVSSLALVVAGNLSGSGDGERYLARLDALRGESYVAGFRHTDGYVVADGAAMLVPDGEVTAVAQGRRVVGPGEAEAWQPHVRGLPLLWDAVFAGPVNLADWEPAYGRPAEAQVKWEATHGRALRP